jgi:DNA (cytosine-5)-methyltransferase 1
MNADTLLRIEDHFCGAGGNTTGAKTVEGVEVVHAANHSRVAIATHETNYPEVEHTLGDIPTLDPRRHSPPADVLITSPECKEHSYAKGREKDDPSLFDPTGDQTAERSRSTMDEVPRWAEIKRYQAVIVENVPQIVHWCEPRRSGHRRECRCGVSFRSWLRDMTNLGYEHRKVYLNSGFFPPVPQSRDRIYIVFWRRGQRIPELDYHPACWCESCGHVVPGVQAPKAHLKKPDPVRLAWGPHDTVWGRYGEQYIYACIECAGRANPAFIPAGTAIEWWREAVPIGEREQHGMRPLEASTLARIRRGVERLPQRPMVVPLDYLTSPESRTARDVIDPLPTITAQHRSALVVQVAGNLGRMHPDGSIERHSPPKAWHIDEQLRTISATLDRALVTAQPGSEATACAEGVPGIIVPAGGPARKARTPSEPLNTILTRESSGIVQFDSPLVVPYRANTRSRAQAAISCTRSPPRETSTTSSITPTASSASSWPTTAPRTGPPASKAGFAPPTSGRWGRSRPPTATPSSPCAAKGKSATRPPSRCRRARRSSSTRSSVSPTRSRWRTAHSACSSRARSRGAWSCTSTRTATRTSCTAPAASKSTSTATPSPRR